MQGCLIKCAIIKGLAACNADDSIVGAALLADSTDGHQGAINALDAEVVCLWLDASHRLQEENSAFRVNFVTVAACGLTG